MIFFNGRTFIHYACIDAKCKTNKYKKYFPTNYFDTDDFVDSDADNSVDTETDESIIIDMKPAKHDIIKYDSHLHCCQMCGGSRFSCKAVFHETNQYGKGVYRQGKKFKEFPMQMYHDYVDSLDD